MSKAKSKIDLGSDETEARQRRASAWQNSAPRPTAGFDVLPEGEPWYIESRCDRVPIAGGVLSMVDLPATSLAPSERPGSVWVRALRIVLSHETLAVDRENVVKVVPPGKVVIVRANYHLRALDQASVHETHTVRVWMQPTFRRLIADGLETWEWEILVAKDAVLKVDLLKTITMDEPVAVDAVTNGHAST